MLPLADRIHEPDSLAALGSTRRAYVVPELKLLYISLAKNACTSIKWLIAELAGEDLDSLLPTTGPYPTREAGIHNRSVFQRTPRLDELPDGMRETISGDNGWMIFTVLRDPRTRLFSAWENKYLLRNPAYRGAKFTRPWAPRVPTEPQHVIDDFAKFVFDIYDNPDHEVFQNDAHFRSQTFLLREDAVPYTHLYDISELKQFEADLTAHLRAQGHTGEVALGKSNDTPLPANREVFAGGVREAIEKLYAEDFARFPDAWDFSRVEAREMQWTRESFAHVRSIVDANERIGDLAGIARRLKERNERLEERLARLREERDAAATTLPSRVLRKIRG
jgi:hypothetical protein